MRSTFVFAATTVANLAAGSPVTASQGAAACSNMPAGSGPASSPDTLQTFLSNEFYDSVAQNAPTPDGYSQSFSDIQGSIPTNATAGFITQYTLTSYDTIQCQEYCDAASSCAGFNVYFERDPSQWPGAACPNPPSTVNYICTLWETPVTSDMATYTADNLGMFQIGIAGSNGYSKNLAPPSCPGFVGPVEFGGAINAPGGYMGYKFFSGPYDPCQCASACQENTAWDKAHPNSDGSYDTCRFFNSYIQSINGVPQGTYCSLYTAVWGKQYSVNYQQTRGSDLYSNSQSYGYSLISTA